MSAPDAAAKTEEELFETGPLSVLTQSVKANTQAWAPPRRPLPGGLRALRPQAGSGRVAACVGGSEVAALAALTRSVRRAGAHQLPQQPQAARAY